MAHYDSSAAYDSGILWDEPEPAPLRKKKHMAQVKTGLDGLNADETIALANTVKTAMTGNANFTTPTPPLATIGTAITTANTKIAAVNTIRAQLDTAMTDRDLAVAVVAGLVTQEGAYVQNTSGGDPLKIQSAGFEIRAAAAPITLLQVMSLAATCADMEGNVDIQWDPVRGAKSYEIQITLDPNVPTSWAYKMGATKSSATIGGLTSGTKIWMRVRALGANNTTGAWSDPAAKIVP